VCFPRIFGRGTIIVLVTPGWFENVINLVFDRYQTNNVYFINFSFAKSPGTDWQLKSGLIAMGDVARGLCPSGERTVDLLEVRTHRTGEGEGGEGED